METQDCCQCSAAWSALEAGGEALAVGETSEALALGGDLGNTHVAVAVSNHAAGALARESTDRANSTASVAEATVTACPPPLDAAAATTTSGRELPAEQGACACDSPTG